MFVRPDQLLEEFEKVIDIILYIFRTLKFDNYTAQISLRDKTNREKYIGTDENWEKAEQAIIRATEEKGLKTTIEYGEAAFYGPKLDFMVRDAIGRKWQLGTIQVDYNLPERFDLTYKGADDKLHRPIMIHRAPFGSMERFVAVLLGAYGGQIPAVALADQVVVYCRSRRSSTTMPARWPTTSTATTCVRRSTTATRRSAARSATTSSNASPIW